MYRLNLASTRNPSPCHPERVSRSPERSEGEGSSRHLMHVPHNEMSDPLAEAGHDMAIDADTSPACGYLSPRQISTPINSQARPPYTVVMILAVILSGGQVIMPTSYA